MIGIIGAMGVEVDAIKEIIEERVDKKIGPNKFAVGKINGKDVVVSQCGIGKVAAAICAQNMIQNFKLDYLLNVGVAGSLSLNLDVCSIAISSSLVQHDMDTTPLGDPIGFISGINIVNIEADQELVKRIEKAVNTLNLKSEIGVIASGDQFINDKAKKDWIKDTFNAIACEMEGAAVAQTAYVNSVPFCVIRAISDNADDSSHMDFGEFQKKAVSNTVEVIKKLI